MQNILLLVVVVVVASIAAASIVGLNVAQVVYAASSTSGTCPCGSGNPHVADPDNPEQRTNPQEKIIGNPHDIESGVSNGNPHIPPT
jgi:hypothetical protein